MKQGARQIGNSLAFTVGNIIYLFVQWLISVLIVKINGYADAGIFSLAMTISNTLYMIACYGIRSYQVSDINQKFTDYTYYYSRYVTCALSMAVCVIFLIAIGYDWATSQSVLLYMLFKTVEAMADVLYGIWQKNSQLSKVGVSYILKGGANLLCFVAVYSLTLSLVLALLAMFLSSLAVFLVYDMQISRRFINLGWHKKDFDLKGIVGILKIGLLLMGHSFCVALMNTTNRLVLEKYTTTDMLGIFTSLSTPTIIIPVFFGTVMVALSPMLREKYDTDVKKLVKLLLQISGTILILGIAAYLFCYYFAEFFLVLIFNAEIANYTNVFNLLIISTVITAFNYCYSYFFIAVRKLKTTLFCSAVGVALVLLFSSALIPIHGLYGAAYAMIFAQLLQLAVELVAVFIIIRKRRTT